MPEPTDPRPTAPVDDTALEVTGTPVPLWRGTGLCCEAQGDGVPCQGTDGECEHCGRALPGNG